MSRSGYSENCDGWALIRWRGAVASAIRGKRGQAFLNELAEALDAMPEKRLIPHSFGEKGSYCTLGVIGAARNTVLPVIDPDTYDEYAEPSVRELAATALNIPEAMAAEIMYENDVHPFWEQETPERRWQRMRAWVAERIKTEAAQP